MSENSKIQWCDDTHNFWQPRVRSKDFDAPLRWNKKPWVCGNCGHAQSHVDYCDKCKLILPVGHTDFHRRRVFSLSLDWLDDEVPIEWLADMLDVTRWCPNLDFLLLTKGPENWKQRLLQVGKSLPDRTPQLHPSFGSWLVDWVIDAKPPKNVWIGCTVENQEYADKRIPELLKIPAVCRFVSYEPALGPVDFEMATFKFEIAQAGCYTSDFSPKFGAWINWIIVGGESGAKARPFNIELARSTIAQCHAAGVKCFVKQLGAFPVTTDEATPDAWPPGTELENGCEEKLSLVKLRDKKGGDMAEWPIGLRVREFPTPLK